MRALAILLALAPASAMAQTAPVTHDKAPWWMSENVITQTGHAFVEAPANRAIFTATFLSNATTVEAAQAKAMDKTRGLQDLLGRLGRDQVRVTTAFSMK